jgi:para-nitrobenzyl esterase
MPSRFIYMLMGVITIAAADPCTAQIHPESKTPRVTVESGVLEGTQFGQSPNETAFLGVPYAAPPVGGLRWKPPLPAAKWHGPWNAAEFGPACPQLPAGWLPYPKWSEDCLFLNVWSSDLGAKSRRPVLVFFHGGSNRAGYSQFNRLGPSLSPLGVVVVSANYRLGPFGFLAHPALTAESPHHSSGNYGLLDQIQAIKWVRQNIAQFGGDPSRITVMGQSAGAVDVCLLMASPLASGLFQQAILQSGECQGTLNKEIRMPIFGNGISGTGEGAGGRLAKDLGVADGPNILHKLRSLSADKVLKVWSADRQIQFDAIVDGWVVPEQPAKIFAEGRQAHIPVLVGSNADEATVFGRGPTTVSAYRKYLEADSGAFADQEFHAWPAALDADVPMQYLQLQSDSFAYGAWSMATSMTRAGEPAYLYLFTWRESGKRAELGAYHGEELAFLDNSFSSSWGASQGDDAFGTIVRRYWSQFAKTGDPNAPDLPHWPTYGSSADHVLHLGQSIQLNPTSSKFAVLEDINARMLRQRFDATARAD